MECCLRITCSKLHIPEHHQRKISVKPWECHAFYTCMKGDAILCLLLEGTQRHWDWTPSYWFVFQIHATVRAAAGPTAQVRSSAGLVWIQLDDSVRAPLLPKPESEWSCSQHSRLEREAWCPHGDAGAGCLGSWLNASSERWFSYIWEPLL